MEWHDEGLVLSTRRHGEGGLIVELLTRERGRHLGLVKGGRRHAATLTPGNSVVATWRARLDEHLGNYAVEPAISRAAMILASERALSGIQLVAALVRLLPERDPHPEIFAAASIVADNLDDPPLAGELMVRFELAILAALGLGLDLAACALTGAVDDLAYVSPRSGRAASREAGLPHAGKLLALPRFIVDRRAHEAPGPAELAAGFRLSAHFLEQRVFGPRGEHLPAARAPFVAAVASFSPRSGEG